MFFVVIGIILPIIFVAYNLICYIKKMVIYTIKNEDFKIINKDFYKIQLGLSLINALCMVINSYIADKISNTIGFLLFMSVFWGINYLIKFIAISKGYATK